MNVIRGKQAPSKRSARHGEDKVRHRSRRGYPYRHQAPGNGGLLVGCSGNGCLSDIVKSGNDDEGQPRSKPQYRTTQADLRLDIEVQE